MELRLTILCTCNNSEAINNSNDKAEIVKDLNFLDMGQSFGKKKEGTL